MDANRRSRKAVLLVLAVFVLGIALGALGSYIVTSGRVWGARTETKGPRDMRTRLVERLTRELNLSPEQQKQLGTILADMQARYDVIHKQIAPQAEQVRQQGRDQIRAILAPEQRAKFEEYLRRLDEQRRQDEQRKKGYNR